MITNKIELNAERLGFQFVGKNDEKLIPRYPAIIVSPGPKSKEVHATHTFNVEHRVFLWIYHAKMTETYRERSDNDIALAEAVEALLEENLEWDDQIIFGFVENSQPGILQPRSERSDIVVGTRLSWFGLTQKRFA